VAHWVAHADGVQAASLLDPASHIVTPSAVWSTAEATLAPQVQVQTPPVAGNPVAIWPK
jgi:hypothetical protein